jgi:hypothetical protein
MISFSDNPIIVSDIISEDTITVIFNNEEIILMEIGITEYAHKVSTLLSDTLWQILYLKDYNYFSNQLTRKILIEKIEKHSFFYCNYDFFEPVEVICKGCDNDIYKKLFLSLKEHFTFEPEKTLILRRKP